MDDITNDLIDEYLNDQFEQSAEEYDEERYFEEAEIAASQAAEHVTAPEESATAQDTNTNLAPHHYSNDYLEENEVEDSNSPHLSQTYNIERRTNDIYSFDRYNKQATWRGEDENNASNRMVAKRWKHSTDTESNKDDNLGMKKNVGFQQKTAPSAVGDSQLLIFQRQQCSRRCNTTTMPLHPIPGKECIPMTLGDGTRVYLTKTLEVGHVEEKLQNATDNRGSSNRTTCLLNIPMSDLMNRVNNFKRSKELAAIKRAARRENNTSIIDVGIDQDDVENETPAPPATVEGTPELDQEKSNIENQLWVDKHSPTSFAHLLSDERSNRAVIRALRAWDPYVFNRQPPAPRPNFKEFGNNNFTDHNETDGKQKTKDRRPDQQSRVILLSGVPGVGKTTLAHVVASHCGYRPIEVNGSDERSESSLLDRIIRGMESTTLDSMFLSSNALSGRPNCLIVDEIDGVDTKSTIQALVDIIRAEIPPTGTSTKGSTPYLRRPIIFICNNKYAPALKPLLPHCRFQFTVYPPQTTRLVARLRAILTAENLSVHTGNSFLLNQLVTLSCGDIRSCLFTLQFAASNADVSHTSQSTFTSSISKDISKSLMMSVQGTGLKDQRNDFAGVIATVFRRPKEVKNYGNFQEAPSKNVGSAVDRVMDTVKSLGECSRILDCLFLNVLNTSYIDPTFDRCAAVHEWLSSADLFRSNKTKAIDYEMESLHIPTSAGAVHLFCRVEQLRNDDLIYTTRELSDCNYQMEINQSIAKKFVEGLSTQSQIGRCIDTVVGETIPYTLWILSAGDGNNSLARAAASVELLGVDERKAFQSHSDALRYLGLTYVANQQYEEEENSEIGMNTHWKAAKMTIEPPIDKFIQYKEISIGRREIPSHMKEMLSRNAVHDKIRQMTMSHQRSVTEASSIVMNKTSTDKEVPESMSIVSIPNEVVDDSTTIHNPRVLSEKRKIIDDATTTSLQPDVKPLLTNEQNIDTLKTKHPHANFLLIGAKRAKLARSARNAARVKSLPNSTSSSSNHHKVEAASLLGSTISTKKKTIVMSNTGSGVPLQNVIRLKYVKGFTQAVRTPCQLEDLI